MNGLYQKLQPMFQQADNGKPLNYVVLPLHTALPEALPLHRQADNK